MEAKRNLIKVIYCNCFIIFTNIIVVVIHFNGCCYVQVVFTNPRIPFSTVPAAGFTQRATIDPGLNEIHVLSVSRSFLTLQYF